MPKTAIGLAGLVLLCAVDAHAQVSPGTPSAATNTVGSTARNTLNGVTGAATPFDLSTPGTGSSVGGELPGGLSVKVGDRVIKFRGAVGVGDDRTNFRAGAGIPF